MEKLLITGVAGFIGSNFARYIAKNYEESQIVGVDNLSPYSSRASISDLEEDGRLRPLLRRAYFLQCMSLVYNV